jgi:eukaryotic-like serine/threonine-protein kinase
MQRIRELILEAHRRSLWQVLAVYTLGSWAAYEIIAEVTDRLGMPEWVPGFAIVLFLIGLPIVVATAFVQEGLPGQVREPGPADPTLVPGLEGNEIGERRATSPLLTPARPHFFLTWQRSVLAGIVAFLLLGITASSYMGLRQAGVGPFASLLSAGTLDERDRIIVAQLAHAAGDTVTADALTEALRVDLAQSRVLTVMEQRAIGDAMQRMGRARDERLTAELARDMAVREGAKAVLEGEIAPAGSGFLITARLVHSGTGEVLLSRRETAVGDHDIISAIDRMSKKLRADVGESLRTVRADQPLEAVTTHSLTALHKYTQAVRAMDLARDYDRAIPLLKEAIAEDSAFAMAWRKLAVSYYNTFAGRSNVAHATSRAYELRDRLTERERYHMIAFHALTVRTDVNAAVNAYRSLLELYPTDHAALNNIALAYGRIQENELAAEYYRRALASDSSTAATWTNLAMVEYKLGKRDEARRLLDETARRFPQQHRDDLFFSAQYAYAERDYEDTERLLRELVAEIRGSEYWRATANFLQGNLRLTQGRVKEARRHHAEASSANRARGVAGTEVQAERIAADIEGWIHQRPENAVRALDALVASDTWRRTEPGSRNYLETALAYARYGDATGARRLLAEWGELPEDEQHGVPMWIEPSTRGWIALAEGRPDDAIAPFRAAATVSECMVCGMLQLGIAYEQAGVQDSAIAYYRRYIDTPQMTRMMDDAWDLPVAYERLAELYARAGNDGDASRYAGEFVEIWKNADPELQPRVQRMSAMLRRGIEQ